MASYDIGDLLLKLGFEGERDFTNSLRAFERQIQAADRAGETFYNRNRTGYNELKTLITNSATQMGTLEQRYRAGEISARQYAKALETIRAVQQVAAQGGTKLSSSLAGVDEAYKQIRNTANTTEAALQKYEQRLTIIDNLHRAGVTSTRQFRRELDELKDEAMSAASGMNKLSQEYTEYVSIAGRAGAIQQRVDQAGLRDSYFSRQFILGNALSNMYGELGIRAFDLAANTIRSFDDMAVAWERSVDQANELVAVSASMGASFTEVSAHVEAVAEKYFVLATDAEGAAAALLDAGLSTEQVRDLLDAVGASALQNGVNVREAFATIANSGGDVEGALTDATGATEAYDRALLSAASGQRDMVASLSATERQSALVAAVTDTAGDALDGYKTRTDGIVGAQLAQSEAVAKFRREMGEELAPTVLKTTEMMTAFVEVMTNAVGPAVNFAEAVAMIVGRVTGLETSLLGFLILGPRFMGWLKGTTLATAGVSAALNGVVSILGGWPGVIAIAGVAAISFFRSMETGAEKAQKAVDKLGDVSGTSSAGLQMLKEATDKQGLLGAVETLAASMDGDAKTAFTDFATNAVNSADTTVDAIDTIYAYLAQQQKVAVQDALDTVNMALKPLEDSAATTTEFNTTGDGSKLEGLRAQAADLEAQIKGIQDTWQSEGLDVSAAQIQLEQLNLQLQSVYGNIANIESQGASRGVLSPNEQAEAVRLLEQRRILTEKLSLLENKPRQAVDQAFGIKPPSGSGSGRSGSTGTGGDPLQDFRNNVSLARAEVNAFRAEHERLGTDGTYVQLVSGMTNYLNQVGLLRSQMQLVNAQGNLSKANQVELVNLIAEEAALRAEIGNSDNVERERKAAGWVAGLEQKLGAGNLEASDGMERLTDAAANLKKEMDQFPEWSVMTPEQRNQFEMFQRLLGMVEGGMETFQAKLNEENKAEMFETAMRNAREFQKVSQEIPEEIMDVLSESGANMDIFESYNEGIREGVENAAALLDVQMDLEESIIRAAREQRNAGEQVTPVVNRRDALQAAADAAASLDTPDSNAAALAYQAEADALSVVILRSQGLAEVRQLMAEQSSFVTDAFDEAGRAAQASAEQGGSALEQQQARVESLRGSLDSAIGSWGRTSLAARQLTSELAPMTAALQKSEAFWDSMGEANPDAVLVELATQQYSSFAEAVEGLGLAADDTGPLMEALKEAFNMDEVQPQIDRLKEMAEAVETVRFAIKNGLDVPQSAADVLAAGGNPLQSPDGSTINTAALRDANLLIRDYNAGRAAGPALVSDLREAESQLLAEYDKINASTAEGRKRLKDYSDAIAEIQNLLGKESKLNFLAGANAQGLVSDKDFGAFVTEQLEFHKEKQAELFDEALKGNKEAQDAWNGHQAAINLLTGALEEAQTPMAALSLGFANLSASLTAAGMDEAAAGADILAGTFAGLDAVLKGGSVEDGVRAIGEAFQQSADVGVAALGKMISGVTDLAVGIASGNVGSIVGGALGLLAGLIDIFTMGAKELAEAQEEVRNYEKGFSIVDPTGAMSARAPTSEESRATYDNARAQAAADGILWPWEDYDAWKQAVMPIKVDDASLKASFEGAESGLGSALKNALKSAAQGRGMGDFREAFREAVLDGVIDGFLASKAFQDALGTPLNDFYTVANDPLSSQADIDAAWKAVEAGYVQAESMVMQFGERWADTFGADQLASDLKGMFSQAFAEGSGPKAFTEAFTLSLKEMVKQRLVEAFMESAAMKPLFDQLGALLGESLKDGIVDAGEQAQIDGLVNQIGAASETLYDSIKSLGGSDTTIKVGVDDSSLAELWEKLDELNDNSRLAAKEAELREEIRINNTIKDRVKLSIEDFKLQRATLLAKGNLTQAERQKVAQLDRSIGLGKEYLGRLNDQNAALEEQIGKLDTLDDAARASLVKEIKVRLGIDVDSLRGSLEGAFDASSYEEFVNGFGGSVRDTVRNAMVAAFLESAGMSAVLKRLSDAIFNALRDGEVNVSEMAGIRELSKEAQKLGGEFYKILEQLGLTMPKQGGKQQAPDMSKWNLDKLFAERAKAAEKGNKKRREEIELEIKARLKISKEDISSQLRSAFDSTNFSEFQKKWGQSLHDITRNALITAFLEGAIMGPLITALSNQLMNAMADNTLSSGERAGIKQTQDQISAEAKVFFKFLEELGLGFKKVGQKKEYDPSKDNIEELFRKSGRGNKKAREEIDMRLKIDVNTIRGALEKAFDSTNLSAFHKNFGEAMREITRDAMIAAFLESSVMQALFTTFSTTIRAALADGVISSGEMSQIKADQKAIAQEAAPFFQLLKSLGLGFKGPKQEPNFSEMSMEELQRRRGRARGKRREEIEVEIKGRLSLNKDDIGSDFRAALETGSNSFKTNWRRSLRATTRDALIAAFMETAGMQRLYDKLGDSIAAAVRDKRITGDEKNRIGQIGKEIEAEGKLLQILLKQAGLGYREYGYDFEKMDFTQLFKGMDKAIRKGWKGDALQFEAEIKGRLSISREDFGNSIRDALDSDTVGDFGTKLEVGVKQSVRDGLIAAFLESAAMKPLLEKLSDGAMKALRDGTVTQGELDNLMKIQGQIKGVGSDFFGLLDDLGLGFKDLNDKLAETTEQMTNVPSGFKVALARFNATEGVSRPGGELRTLQDQGTRGADFRGAQLIIQMPQGSDLDDIIDELDRRGAMKSGSNFGTPIVRSF